MNYVVEFPRKKWFKIWRLNFTSLHIFVRFTFSVKIHCFQWTTIFLDTFRNIIVIKDNEISKQKCTRNKFEVFKYFGLAVTQNRQFLPLQVINLCHIHVSHLYVNLIYWYIVCCCLMGRRYYLVTHIKSVKL